MSSIETTTLPQSKAELIALCEKYELTSLDVATICGVSVHMVNKWRSTGPTNMKRKPIRRTLKVLRDTLTQLEKDGKI